MQLVILRAENLTQCGIFRARVINMFLPLYRPVKLEYFSPFSDLIVIRGLQADSGRGRHQVQ